MYLIIVQIFAQLGDLKSDSAQYFFVQKHYHLNVRQMIKQESQPVSGERSRREAGSSTSRS